MKDNGWMISQMEKGYISIKMVQYMKENGKMILKMDLGKKNMLMGLGMKENLKMGIKMEKENFIGKIIHIMKEILLKII